MTSALADRLDELLRHAGTGGLRQPDQRSCGAACLVVARMLLDPAYADLAARAFRPEVLGMHGRVTGPVDARGALQVPWPRALGTPPWAVARQLSLDDRAGATTPGWWSGGRRRTTGWSARTSRPASTSATGGCPATSCWSWRRPPSGSPATSPAAGCASPSSAPRSSAAGSGLGRLGPAVGHRHDMRAAYPGLITRSMISSRSSNGRNADFIALIVNHRRSARS